MSRGHESMLGLKEMVVLKKACNALIVAVQLLLGILIFGISDSRSEAVSAPSIVIGSGEFSAAAGMGVQPDGPLSTFQAGGNRYWLIPLWDKVHGGIVHIKALGSVDRPLQKVLWAKTKAQLFKRNDVLPDGNLWIVSTYRASDGILAFVHVENADGTGAKHGKHINGGKSRIGLAWSQDHGESFFYLGDVVIPFGDPDPFNIQGAPYIIQDGYFYIYFHDTSGLTVARAPSDEVIAGARSGKITEWMKYAGPDAGFSSPALGGESIKLGIDGVSHSGAACSTITRKCYLILTMMTWGGRNTWIKLFESPDGIRWMYTKDIVNEAARIDAVRGYQYASIVDAGGNGNGMAGDRIFIFSGKNHLDQDRETYRWQVDLRLQ